MHQFLASLRMPVFATPRRLLLLPVALLFTACATTVTPPPAARTEPQPASPQAQAPVPEAVTDEEQMLQVQTASQDRLYRVAAPLLVNNAELCRGNARNLIGFTAKNKFSFSSAYAAAAQKALGLDERLRITGVLPGGGAERAGVQRGDILIAVEGQALPEGENAERQAAIMLAPLVTGRTSVKVHVLRDGRDLLLDVPLTYACAFGVELGNTDNVNAYADGHRVLITRGMMNWVRSDEELAYVMAKEMAHNVLAHASRQRMSATIGGIIDNLTRMRPDMSTMVGLAGVKPMPQNLDAMADRLSLYLLARAGYGIDQVIPFWQRLATTYPPTVPNAYTALHPATAYRVSAMERTLRDIRNKLAASKPLMP